MKINKKYTAVMFSLIALTFAIGLGVSLPSAAFAQDLQNDDLLVGAGGVEAGFGYRLGIVWRLRGASLDKFCESSARTFFIPDRVMVDSQGRVVFVAGMFSANLNYPHMGLFRCNALGAVPELLAVFPGVGDPTPGDPVPFPGQHFDLVSGLHLARAVAGTIDDRVNDGNPQLVTEDLYVLVVGNFNTTGQRVAVRTVRYHTASGRWDEGPAPCAGADCPRTAGCLNCGNQIYAINHGGVTYFAGFGLPGTLRRVKDPLSLDISGQARDISFSISLSLFGGARELRDTLFDYVNLDHIPSGCPPDPLGQISNLLPGGYGSHLAEREVVFDEWGDLGLVMSSPSFTALEPYQANVSEALLDKPGDLTQYFQNPYEGCAPRPAIKMRMIMPFSGPDGGNVANELVSAPSGLAGTIWQSHQVVRLVPGSDRLQVLANRSMFPDLLLPMGLGAFPATASVGGVVILLRIDSPANVVVTGPDGRRIGVDPATGLPINDFGDDGVDSGPGTPRFFALRNAAPGSYSVQSVATDAGSFAVHVYSADPAQPLGNHIVSRGVAAIGDINNHNFTLDPTGGIVFVP